MTASESEPRTRKKRIDPRLRQAGWADIVPFDGNLDLSALEASAVEEYPTDAGPADYALCDRGRLLSVVEAKKLTVGPEGVLTQSARYSRGLHAISSFDLPDGHRVPFLYSTNGERIMFHDVRHTLNRSREVFGFHTPEALDEMLGRDPEADLVRLRRLPMHAGIRPYQVEASEAIEAALAQRRRKMLVTMATGTGKTLMTVHQVYRLMKSGAARRVLFLVDRKALAAQTVRAFKSFEAEPGRKFDSLYEVYSQRFRREDFGEDEKFDISALPPSYLMDPTPGTTFVYVCTIQRMTINLFGRQAVFGDEEAIEDDADKIDNIPIHAFDLIVADECHRGYSASEAALWRKTLDHFDAVKIGLTATPAQHTMAYFENLVYRYDYERAVREGYLVDYDVVRLKSDVRMNGVFLKEGDAIDSIDPESGQQQFDYLEDERVFDTTEIERKITAPDSNLKILQEIKRYCEEHEAQHGRFPKTLIFAVNDLPHTSHADQLVRRARQVFDRGEEFVAKITGRVDRPLQRIREFRNRPKPMVVVSVDMLTTGVDIPDLEFLVFLRPVKSRILFEQMLGRGTRRGDRYPDKANFVVFDCFDGTLLEYFRNTTGITAEPPESDTKTIGQVIEDIWANRDREYSVNRLIKRLQRIDKQMAGEARDDFAAYLPDGDVGAFATTLKARLKDSFTETMKLLRDPGFQDLLVNYKRPGRAFYVAHGVTDTVESGWLIRGGDGREYKPEDYLQAFERFVRENDQHIQALQILLARPQEWSTEALKELRETLTKAPERFTEANLRKAFEATHHKALIDIISMVKRAADDIYPLLTAEERVNVAIARVSDQRSLTPDQAKWLEYIRAHLVQNLSIDHQDFDEVPVLANRGGWGRANRVFDGQLAELLVSVQRELVAA
ncbi:MAG: type I restriction-modification enzyme R subunit C-terminal domain-containing protein [Thermomicrobiales bacterium]